MKARSRAYIAGVACSSVASAKNIAISNIAASLHGDLGEDAVMYSKHPGLFVARGCLFVSSNKKLSLLMGFDYLLTMLKFPALLKPSLPSLQNK